MIMNKTIGKIFSNLVPNADEIMNNARGLHRRNIKSSAANVNNLDVALKSGVYGKGFSPGSIEASSKLEAFRKSASISESYDKNFDRIKSYVGDNRKSAINHYKNNRDLINQTNTMFDEVTPKSVITEKFNNLKGGVRDYYSGDSVSKEARMARIGATSGAVAGIGIGSRFLSGGNATTNSKGERDIVGIPFI